MQFLMSFFLLQNNWKYHFKPFVPIRAKDVQLGALNKTVNIFILGKNWVVAHCKWYTLLAMRLNLPYWSKKSDCCGLIYMGYKYNEFFAPNYKPCAELADLTVKYLYWTIFFTVFHYFHSLGHNHIALSILSKTNIKLMKCS